MEISEAYRIIHDEIAEICDRVGRDVSSVKVLAVSKTVGKKEIQTAIDAGFTSFAENRIERLEEMRTAFPAQEWHFIGNIQSRKIPRIVSYADMIHSVYEDHHLAAIDRAALNIDKNQGVLIEVNTSGEQSKGGIHPSRLEHILEHAQRCEAVTVCGLMTMAPIGDRTIARQCFEQLAELKETYKRSFGTDSPQVVLNELSMGMSQDWQEAVASGATIIRIGRMIFDDAYRS